MATEPGPARPAGRAGLTGTDGLSSYTTRRDATVEPLFRMSGPFCFLRYRVPKVAALTELIDPLAETDWILDLLDAEEGPMSFALTVGPNHDLREDCAASLSISQLYRLTVLKEPADEAPADFLHSFVARTPDLGTLEQQAVTEEHAIVEFHQAAKNRREMIVYGPNGAGEWQIVFAVQMFRPPVLRIEFEQNDLYVDESDIVRDRRAPRATLRFKVRSHKSGSVIKYPVSIRSIALEAEL